MRISTSFPSEYLRAADLQGREITVLIDRVEIRDLGGDPKPVLFFEGKSRGLVLNKTNGNVIADVYGDETDDWTGKPVVLYEALVDFQGRRVPAIRVRVPRRPDVAAPPPARRPAPPPVEPTRAREPTVDDEIPF